MRLARGAATAGRARLVGRGDAEEVLDPALADGLGRAHGGTARCGRARGAGGLGGREGAVAPLLHHGLEGGEEGLDPGFETAQQGGEEDGQQGARKGRREGRGVGLDLVRGERGWHVSYIFSLTRGCKGFR